uniref:Uncharacterized protein n=1 Tax=Trypanosoma vivax (strain Y486) TaxID=1055687 RepID=G0TUC9_TRYVY|nr:conserved hypothetical protein, unlikely [Trypanosoma vivax Y486]
MSQADVVALLITLAAIVNVLSVSFPLLRRCCVRRIAAFMLLGFAGMLLLLGLFVLLMPMGPARNKRSALKVRELIVFIQRGANVTLWMTLSVLVMTCWIYCRCRKGYRVYVLPMLKDLHVIERTCWTDTLDLRKRTISTTI